MQVRLQKLESAGMGAAGSEVGAGTPFHTHTKFDMNPVVFSDIDQKHLYIPWTIPGVQAATSTNYNPFFIVPVSNMRVYAFYEVHSIAGTAAGSVTLQLEQLTGTTAPGSGNAILGTALSLKATANTVQTATLTTTAAYVGLSKGYRLGLVSSGTLTTLANVSVLVDLIF